MDRHKISKCAGPILGNLYVLLARVQQNDVPGTRLRIAVQRARASYELQ